MRHIKKASVCNLGGGKYLLCPSEVGKTAFVANKAKMIEFKLANNLN